ncbi:hypothetical protein [Burkholderia metallica]|nr:hypothetical protein [Burkholderia metallica]
MRDRLDDGKLDILAVDGFDDAELPAFISNQRFDRLAARRA